VVGRLTSWRPRAGLPRAEALEAWERHVELVARLPGLRRYVQNRALASPDGGEPPFAGVGELWFDDAEAARAALTSPEWQAVLDDAVTFMELESVVATWVERGRMIEAQPEAGGRVPGPSTST
jgi:uncharacterized protein (TIGR02118 family)